MSNNPTDDVVTRTIPEAFARVFWMLLGPLLLVPITFKVVEYGNGWLTVFDFAFLGVLCALMLARCFEFFKGHPLTAEGQPATPSHLKRYLVGTVAVGLPIWVAANVLGNYILNSPT